MLRRSLFGLIGLVVLLLSPGLALAHAAPVGLEPPHGAVLGESPAHLRLRLTQPVELGFSRVTVRAGTGVETGVVVETGALRLDGDRVVVVDLPPLLGGQYDVSWRVLSIDGHVTEGDYSFSVKAGAAGAAPGPAVAGAVPERRLAPGIYGGAAALLVAVLALVASLLVKPGGARRKATIQRYDTM